MTFIYANQRRVLYKLENVLDIQMNSKLVMGIMVVDTNLAWTLGDDFRPLGLKKEGIRSLDNGSR